MGCGSFFSRQVLQAVDRDLTFSRVIENPGLYVGTTVLWGGVIRENISRPEGTEVIVTQTPLDPRAYPQAQATEGEFLARTPLYLDPERYRPGIKITIAGEIQGVEEKQLGPMEYPRPVLKVLDLYLWEDKLWGIFPLSRGWGVDQYRPVPSPFEYPHEEGSSLRRSFP